MRIRHWPTATLLALGLATPTWAVEPTSTTRTPPRQHEYGDVRWSDWMVSTTLDTCDPRLIRTEPPREDQLHYNCVSHVMEMRSESDRPIQCRMRIDLAEPGFNSSRGTNRDEIIYPGRAATTYELLAPTTSLPASFSATCKLVPQEAPPPPQAPPNCTLKFEGKYIDEYYPRSAIYRKQEGVAEVDFTIGPGRKSAADRTLVRSSGFESLDRESLRVMYGARPVSNCEAQRFRAEITFKLEDERQRVVVRWIPGSP